MSVARTGLLTFAALALAACATSPEPSASTATAAPVGHVVVAPLNLAIDTPEVLDGKDELVWHELLRHFQALHKQVSVISPISAERLWLEATLDQDPPDESLTLEAARSRFAKALAEHRAYDLLVVPTVVLRPARIHGLYASWDGVRRAVPGGSDMIPTGIASTFQHAGGVEVMGLRGIVAAASLHVTVLRSDGVSVHESIAGLDLIQEVDRDRKTGRWQYATRPEPFGDSENLREGVERAFETAVWMTAPGSDTDDTHPIAATRAAIDR